MSFIDNIKEIPITDYAERCGYTLVRKGRRYVSLAEHDSVMIDTERNCFWRNSVFKIGQKGGAGSIIDFAMEFQGLERDKALRELAVMYGIEGDKAPTQREYKPIPKTANVKKKREPGDLDLPPKAKNANEVFHYLNKVRKIDLSVIKYFIAKDMLYQDAKHNNCVFVTDKFGCVRSTGEKRFMLDLEGCDYNECFFFRPSKSATTLVVTESVIDVMSVMTQFAKEGKRYTDYSYLALSGVNKLESLFYHIEREKDINHIMLAFDNDEKGRMAFMSAVDGLGKITFEGDVEDYSAPSEKDWNEYIQLTVTSEQGEKQPTHREDEQKNITESEDLKMSEEKQRLFVDMDGTLAVFTPVDEMETLYEQGYFSNLKPHENVVAAIRDIVVNHPEIEVNILSAYLSDSQFALAEKNEWLNQYLPEIDQEHRIFVPCGSDKKEGIVGGIRSNDFLLDDYTKNLNDWQPPARGIKLLNAINDTRGSWEHDRIRYDREPSALSEAIVSVMREEQRIFDDKISADKQQVNEVETDTQEQTVSSRQDITITCEWSESPVFEGGKTYSVAEFDRIMAQADKERVEARQTELAKYGSVEEWEATDENSYYRYQSYDKVSFTVNLPNGVTVTERQDIGDGYGGVVDYFRSFTGNSLMSMTANALEAQRDIDNAIRERDELRSVHSEMEKERGDTDAHRSLLENVEVTHGEQEQAELDNGGNAVTTEQKQEALDKELTQEQLERIVAEKSAPVPIDETLPAKDQLTQRLENGVRQVLNSEQFKNWLSTGGKLFYNNYSFRNAMLVWLQKPDATYVMGYEKWKEYGRNVKQGATGAKIIIPFIANEKTKGGLFRTIKNGLTSQFASNPSLKEAVYRLGASNIEFTMNGSNHLIGLRINGSEKQIFGSDEEVKRFIDRAIIGKVATGFSVGTVFDAKDVIIPEYLWLKSGFTKDEIALDDKGNPIKNRRGETKIINTPERQARFQPSLDTKIVAKDAEKMQLLFEACVAASERKGVPVSLADKSTDSTLKGGAKGYYSRQFSADKPNGFIVIDNSLEITEKCAVLLHEMGHSDLHKDLKALAEEMGEKNISREMREVQAEATAFAVAGTFGIETDTSSFKYLAAYARGFDLQEFHKSLEVIFQETQQLTNDIKTELDLKGFNLDLTEKPQGKLEQDTIKSLSKKYVDYATTQTESVQDALSELPHLLEQSEGKADLFEILKQQKQNLDNRKTDIDLLLATVEKLGAAETRTEQEAAVAVLESTAERINKADMDFDSLTEQFVIASEQTRSGLKEDFLRNPYDTLCKMRTDFPKLSNVSDTMLQYMATSKVVSRDLSQLLKNNPQAFVDKAMERAGLLIKVASQSGTFVEINFCEQWTDKPFFENGTLCSPKVADKIISSCEMQVRGFKEQAAKTGDYFPYAKCDMTIFTPSKDGKLLSLNTRVNIGDGEQASLKEHLEKECQRGERKDIFENFSVALRERALKSQLIVQDLSSKSEPPQAEIESPAKDTEKSMNSAEWEKAINNKKEQLTEQADKSNTQEMNTQKGER